MSQAQLETLYSEAVAALDSGDYGTCLTKALALQFRLLATPDLEEDLGAGIRRKLSFRSSDVDKLITHCRQLKSEAETEAKVAAGFFQQTTVTYQRAEATDDYE